MRLEYPEQTGLEPFTVYRFDTAAGSATPAEGLTTTGGAPARAVFRTDDYRRIPKFLGPDGNPPAAVLYRKQFDAAGVQVGAAVAVAGRAPGAQSGAALATVADVDTRVRSALDGQYTVNRPGIRVPAGWGSFWQAALAAGNAKLAVDGDSLSQGYNCSNPLTKSWPKLLAADLQAKYGDGGSGVHPVSYSDNFVSTVGAPYSTAYAAAGALWITTGTWTRGNQGVGTMSLTTSTAGSTATFTKLRGTTIDLFTIDGTPTATWTYSVDGAAAVPVTPSASNVLVRRTITGLSAGEHTVVITYTGSSGTFYFSGARASTGSGVLVDNYSRYGATAAFFTESYGLGWMGGSKQPADLLAVSLGVNDASAAVTGATYGSNIRKLLDDAKSGAGTLGATDVLFIVQAIGKNDNATPAYQDIVAQIYGLAATYNAAVVDMWTLLRNSYTYGTNQSYWGSGTPGTPGADNIHLSDVGQLRVKNAVASVPGLGLAA